MTPVLLEDMENLIKQGHRELKPRHLNSVLSLRPEILAYRHSKFEQGLEMMRFELRFALADRYSQAGRCDEKNRAADVQR